MIEQRIREIANQASTHAEDTVDYYSGIVDGLTWEAKILKARDLKFAELIVRECSEVCRQQQYYDADDEHKRGVNGGSITCMNAIKQHFGVEE
jgi:hypothetical protein